MAAAHAVARRLTTSKRRLSGVLPINAEQQLEHLSEEQQEAIDAFLKRFENLQDIIEGRLFRGLLILEHEDLHGRSSRDIANLLEKLGALGSATHWRGLTILRNKLAHEYPTQPDRQAARLNEAYAAIDELIGIYNRLQAYVAAKGLVDVSVYPPVRT